LTQLTCSIFLIITCDRNNRLHPQIIPSSLFFDADDYTDLFIAISPDRPSYALLHILNTVNRVAGEPVLMHSASVALRVRILMWLVRLHKTVLYTETFSLCSQNSADVFRPVVRLNALGLGPAPPLEYLIQSALNPSRRQ